MGAYSGVGACPGHYGIGPNGVDTSLSTTISVEATLVNVLKANINSYEWYKYHKFYTAEILLITVTIMVSKKHH